MVGAITDAAREIMRAEGVAALSMHEVARRVGLRTQSLYYYFPSKSALYDALFRLGTQAAAEYQARAAAGAEGFWEELRAVMESYMSFAYEQPELWYLVFERPVPGFVPSPESMVESRALLSTGQRAVAAAIDAGVVAPGLSPEQATDLIAGLIHGLTASHMANEPHLPVGSGRFGSLIPEAVKLLRAAWTPTPGARNQLSDTAATTGGGE